MPPRRIVSFLSILVHAAVFAAVLLAQLFTVGPMPVPRVALAYEAMTMVRVADIPLPAAARRPAATSASSNGSPSAPIDAPATIAPEIEAQATAGVVENSTAVAGVEYGVPGGLDGIGAPERIAAPSAPPPPQTRMRLHSGMQPPQKVLHVAPRYPVVAQQAHLEGIVALEAVIDTAGGVQSVRVTRSIPMLDQAAIDAVRQWRFTPTLLNGQPVPVILTVTVTFTLR